MAGETVEDSCVELVLDGAVATMTLNRPDKGNSLTVALKEALRDTLARVAADPRVRAVVLTGAGRSFCVGQDLAEHAEMLRADPPAAFATVREHYGPIVETLTTMPKPVVAAINGACVGAGLGIALACDVRLAADSARFATAFCGIGLTFDSGLSVSLAAAIGRARAKELMLLGRTLDAAKALDWGLVGRVVPTTGLATEAAEVAAELAAGPTAAYAETKRLLAHLGPEVLEREAAAQERLGRTTDHRNAVAAFLEKRPPTFTGHE